MKTLLKIKWDALTVFFISIWIASFSGNSVSAGESHDRLTIDSVEFNGYKALLNEIRKTDYMRKALELVIYRGDKELTRDTYEWIGLQDFCDGETPSGCYYKDINGDGIGEVIVRGIGEGNRFDMAVVYSLADTARELARFNDVSGFYLKDLENDNIRELIFQDNSFVGMYIQGVGAPRPPVIWRWEDGRYKIANFKFSDFILDEFEKRFPEDSIKTFDQFQTDFGIPLKIYQYQRYLFNYTVHYFFAGRHDKAWGIYEKYLPKDVSERKHSRFKLTFEEKFSPYWESMEESNKRPIDSLLINGYRVILFQNQSGDNKPMGFYNDVGIFRGSDSLAYHPNSVHSFDHVDDINMDGITELVIKEYTGGANCCFAGYIYSFGDTLALLLRPEPIVRDFELEDVDGDSIMEIISYDNTFNYWNETYRYYLPKLIWAWDGSKYGIRNFHFLNLIMGENVQSILDSVRVPNALGQEFADFDDNWGRIISLAYAGKLADVDSILANRWSTAAPEQKAAYDLFKKTLQSDVHWDELTKSDW